jgi:hypothetical protein
METTKIKVDIIPNYYVKDNGALDMEALLKFGGHTAGVCYNKEGFYKVVSEPIERTIARENMTLENGHHSVYDHVVLNLNLQNIPKMLAMVLNNEKQYTTSEKSARYTPVVRNDDSIITKAEEDLYNKWLKIFQIKIKKEYGDVYSDAKIKKLAQENARYLVTVFMPTQMIYSTTFRQINYIASWMEDYILSADRNNEFEIKLAYYMQEFINQLIEKNILDERLMRNEKGRKLSLFGTDLEETEEHFGDVYSTTYKGSFAELAQAHRHRTLSYQMQMLDEKEYFVPPIIEDEPTLVDEWLGDIQSVGNVRPQGELVLISEKGEYDNFILKCEERLCSAAQLEIMSQTRETLLKYREALKKSNHRYASDIDKYTKGARCTFPGFKCTEDCKFKEGKTLVRKI